MLLYKAVVQLPYNVQYIYNLDVQVDRCIGVLVGAFAVRWSAERVTCSFWKHCMDGIAGSCCRSASAERFCRCSLLAKGSARAAGVALCSGPWRATM